MNDSDDVEQAFSDVLSAFGGGVDDNNFPSLSLPGSAGVSAMPSAQVSPRNDGRDGGLGAGVLDFSNLGNLGGREDDDGEALGLFSPLASPVQAPAQRPPGTQPQPIELPNALPPLVPPASVNDSGGNEDEDDDDLEEMVLGNDGDDDGDDGEPEPDDAGDRDDDNDNEDKLLVDLSSHASRESAYKSVLERMAAVPGATCMRDIDHTFASEPQEVGCGTRGRVYAVEIGRQGAVGAEPIPAALKIQPMANCNYREIMVGQIASSLVHARCVPNYPIVYRDFTCASKTEKNKALSVMERAKMCLRKEMKKRHGTRSIEQRTYMSILFQVFAAVVGLHASSDIVHNDVKMSNVLISPTQRELQFVYVIMGQRYVVPTSGYVALLGDFGIASGAMIGIAHEDVIYQYRDTSKSPIRIQRYYHDPEHTNRELVAAEKTRGVHVLEIDVPTNRAGRKYAPMPAYARDYWLILHQFLRLHGNAHPNKPSEWIKQALESLHKFEMRKPADSMAYFRHVFSPDTLQAAGLGRDYFSAPVDPDAEQYRL